MKRQIKILIGILAVFLVTLLLLPSAPELKPSRLAMELPVTFGNWKGSPQEPGAAEKKILAQDTEFERMQYVDLSDERVAIDTSLVFAGKNLTQSIHRPEICLRAQGWEFVSEEHIVLENVMPGGGGLPVKEVVCKKRRMQEVDKQLVPVLLKNGEALMDWKVFYYTFIGHTQIVSGHYERTLQDIRDRVMKGYGQRWAYATFSLPLTAKYGEQGMGVGKWPLLDEDGARAALSDFLRELLPLVISEPGGQR